MIMLIPTSTSSRKRQDEVHPSKSTPYYWRIPEALHSYYSDRIKVAQYMNEI
jgi:hypothetical protein